MEIETNGNNKRTAFETIAPEAVAAKVAAALRGDGGNKAARSTTSGAPASTAPTWMSFATSLDQLVASSDELRLEIEATMSQNARVALVNAGLGAPSADEFRQLLRPQPAAKGGTVVRAFWWGFHVQVSHEDLQSFLSSGNVINTVVERIGGNVPVAGPWIQLVAVFVAGALGLLGALDRGRGVYISMSWFAPGAFVPTSV